MEKEYGLKRFYGELQRCVEKYLEQHPLLKQVGIFPRNRIAHHSALPARRRLQDAFRAHGHAT
jgi:hypothetical protein